MYEKLDSGLKGRMMVAGPMKHRGPVVRMVTVGPGSGSGGR